MENHLTGEVVPAPDLTPETVAAADVNVVGYSVDGGAGAGGGRRRQVRNPESVPGAEQANVATRYAQAGRDTGNVIYRPDQGGAIRETTTPRDDIFVIDR